MIEHHRFLALAIVLLMSLCMPMPVNALPVAEAQHISGMISSFFGGIMDAFHEVGTRNIEAEVVGHHHVRVSSGRQARALSGGAKADPKPNFISAGSSQKLD